MTLIHLVRHGETEWHHENRYAGSSDVALTQRGLDGAEALARWAASQPISAIASSPLTRAVETARPSAQVAALDLIVDPRLAEVHFGEGEGLTTAEMRERFPDALATFHATPATSPLPGGEAGTAAARRAMPVLHELVAAHPDGAVLVVMHSTLVRLVLCSLLSIPLDEYRRVFPVVVNTAVSTIRMTHERAALLAFNVPTT